MTFTLIFTLSLFHFTNFGAQPYSLLNPVTTIGYDAVLHNPANLGLNENPNFSLRLASINAFATNNILSFDSYNQYLGIDSAMNDEQKTEFFRTIPDNGLLFQGDVNLGTLDFTYRNFGFAFRRFDLGNLKVSKELIDLVLFGNQLQRNYDFSNFTLDYLSYYSFNFAVGLPLIKKKKQLATIGIGLKYLLGNQASLTEQASGNFYSNEYFIKGQVSWTRNQASGGSGWGFDLGGTYEISKYRFSLALLNISPGITWTENLKTNVKSITIDSTDIYQIVKNNNLNDILNSNDTSYNTESFRTQIPAYLTLGTGWKFDDFGSMLTLIYEQNLASTKFSTFTPKFTFDLEWNLLQVILINPSISLGGREGITYNLGLGKNLRGFLIGINLGSIKNPIITKAKGLKLGLSIGLTLP